MRKVMIMVMVMCLVLSFGYVSWAEVVTPEPVVIATRLSNVTAVVGNPVALSVSGFMTDMGSYWTNLTSRCTFEVSLGNMESETSSVLILPDSGSEDIVVTAHYNDLVSTGTLEVHWSPIKELIVPDSIEVQLGSCGINFDVWATLFDGTKVKVNSLVKVTSDNTNVIEIVNDKYCRVKNLGEANVTFSIKGKVNEGDASFSDITASTLVKIGLPKF